MPSPQPPPDQTPNDPVAPPQTEVVQAEILSPEQDAARRAARQPDTPDPEIVLKVLEGVVNDIVTGGDVSRRRDEIEKLTTGQEERADLIDNLTLTHDYTRLVRFLKAQAKLENYVLAAMDNQQLSPLESLSFLKYITEEKRQLEGRVKAGSTSIKDFVQLINKINYTVQISQRDLEKKLKGTSPQGREIIRRAAYRIRKLAGQPKRETVRD